ncbi:MAG: TolC family protein [Candidatus Aureabacteria bacterium]|nr:TolC family protein [Candidatus Auribacterota bacterium]
MKDKRGYIPFLVILVCCVFCLSLAAETEAEIKELVGKFEKGDFIESAGDDKVLAVSLNECIEYSLKNNLEIEISRENPYLFTEDVEIAGAEFELKFTAELNFTDSSDPSNSEPFNVPGLERFFTPEINTFRDGNLSFGVEGKIITGATYEFFFNNNRYKTNSSGKLYNPSYLSEAGLTVTQPLLRDFGTYINRAEIVIAQNNYAVSSEEFQQTVMDIVSETKEIYFNCIFARDAHSIAKDHLKLAQELYGINKKRYEKGLVSSVELLESESAEAGRMSYVIESESAMRNTEDQLKFITNLVSDSKLWNAKLEFVDTPGFDIVEVNLVDELKNAFEYRPDYKAVIISLQNNNIRIKVAENATLPTLDLTGSFGLNGLGKDVKKAVENIDYKHKDWYAGIKIEIPWGGGERAEHEKRQLEKAIALLGLKNLEHNIILDVRNKEREVEVQKRQVEAAGLFKDTARKNYEAQKKRFNAGQVSTHDMLDYQDSLSGAKLEHLRAVTGYQIALVKLDKASGVVFIKNKIRLEE